MPLPKCTVTHTTSKGEKIKGGKYTSLMFTFGPRPPTLTREEVKEVFAAYYKGWLKEIIIAFEDGAVKEDETEGYPHVHVGVRLGGQKQLTMPIIKRVKQLCVETETRKVNCGTNYVPCEEGKGFEVIKKYLTDPDKIKETDDGALIVLEPRDALADLRETTAMVMALTGGRRLFRETGRVPMGFEKFAYPSGREDVRMDHKKRDWCAWCKEHPYMGLPKTKR